MRHIYACLVLVVFASQVSFAQQLDAEKMKQASVIFVGTISRLNAATFAEVPVSPTTAVVKVEQLLQKPALIPLQEGEELTLDMRTAAGMNAGTRALFYAEGWIMGKEVALREIGRETMPAAFSRSDTRKTFMDARTQMMNNRMRARLDSAEVVALGTITQIHASASAEPGRKRISEHDPDWHDAILKVNNGLKGCAKGDEIVIRFPASIDVAYYGAPKFKKGDVRIFLLRRDTRSGLSRPIHDSRHVEAYIVESSTDVVGKEQLDQILNLMK